ncbi:MAG: LacI family transcriptional regulator [Armatimonadetes bacterium]|nr:LacI family transcriptional regulator [Armatimonadota bacterium]
MAVTIRDIANELKISHTTVSRVLRGKGENFISDATRNKVMQLAQAMGYQPNRIARALVTGHTNLIALIGAHLYTPYSAQVAFQLAQELKRNHYELIVRTMEEDSDERHLLAAPQFPVDGMIAFDYPLGAIEFSDNTGSPSPAIVGMGAYFLEQTDTVEIDLFSVTLEAVQHLVEIGCRRIAYLVSQKCNQIGDDRHDAYQRVIEESGLQPHYIVTYGESRNAYYQTVINACQHADRPDGIFCHNDDMAIGAYRALCDLGLKVPTDVALVGCDGIEDTEYLERPITTIMQPIKEMCALAWKFLKQRIQEPDYPPQRVVLQPKLVIRASSQR